MKTLNNEERLEQNIRECNEYNKKYGKHLSYGYYTAYKTNRWLEQEWLDILSERKIKDIAKQMN